MLSPASLTRRIKWSSSIGMAPPPRETYTSRMSRGSSFRSAVWRTAIAAAVLLSRPDMLDAASAPEGRFGVVLTSDERSLCFQLAGAAPEKGATISVILLDAPQLLLRATVGDRVADCGEPLVAAEPHYRATLAAPVPASRSLAGSAVVSGAHEVVRSEGAVVLRFAGETGDVRLRECASAEGLHLTAWRGEPVRGERIWHAYFYLGYDVEADCDAAEVAHLPLSDLAEQV
jgi:hypothetical protein